MTDDSHFEAADGGFHPLGSPYTIPMAQPKRWRCANGHEWEGEPWNISFDRIGDSPFHREFNCCVECMAEAFARIAVPVEEVKEATE